MSDPETISMVPIGHVRSGLRTKVEAARQPGASGGARATIELLPGHNFEHALEDLEAWEYIWVIFWFHLNRGWRPKVLPPRSVTGRKGVFSTRSPHRPNAIGMSAVRLDRVEGLVIHIRDVDMLDGTPVLDLKPYIAYSDARTTARGGWLAAAGSPRDPIAPHTVEWLERAAEQAAWIEGRTGLALRERAVETLSLGAVPHPYRRIRRLAHDYQLSVKDWRLRFSLEGRHVTVREIRSGYRPAQLVTGSTVEPTRAHGEFTALWPANTLAAPDTA